MTWRIIGTLILFASILFLPYWAYIPMLFLAIIFYQFFWEGIILALLIEVFYGNDVGFVQSLISPLALASLVAVIVVMQFRGNIRSYV